MTSKWHVFLTSVSNQKGRPHVSHKIADSSLSMQCTTLLVLDEISGSVPGNCKRNDRMQHRLLRNLKSAESPCRNNGIPMGPSCNLRWPSEPSCTRASPPPQASGRPPSCMPNTRTLVSHSSLTWTAGDSHASPQRSGSRRHGWQ